MGFLLVSHRQDFNRPKSSKNAVFYDLTTLMIKHQQIVVTQQRLHKCCTRIVVLKECIFEALQKGSKKHSPAGYPTDAWLRCVL
jgi:ribosomal protein L17